MATLNTVCPTCGTKNNRSVGIDTEDGPEADDFSICWNCSTVSVYVETPDGLALRLPTDDEAKEIADDPQIRQALGAIKESYGPAEALALLRSTEETP